MKILQCHTRLRFFEIIIYFDFKNEFCIFFQIDPIFRQLEKILAAFARLVFFSITSTFLCGNKQSWHEQKSSKTFKIFVKKPETKGNLMYRIGVFLLYFPQLLNVSNYKLSWNQNQTFI